MKKIGIFLLFFALGVSVSSAPAGALKLTLKRIIFEGPKRAEVLLIINNTDKEQTYRIGWKHYRMTSEDALVPVPQDQPLPPEIKPVTDMVIFAPRRIKMAPNSSQQVRMILKTPANLPDGEYRSHLWISPEGPVEKPVPQSQRKAPVRGAAGVSVTMLAGVTMPVIVRKGDLTATVSVSDLVAQPQGEFVRASWSFLRDGERSVYGDIDYLCNPGAKDSYNLTPTRGIAIYSELNKRDFAVRFKPPKGKTACRELKVSYTQTDGFNGDRTVVLAEQTVAVK